MTNHRLALLVAAVAASLCIYDTDSPRRSFILICAIAVSAAICAVIFYFRHTKRLFYGDCLLICAGAALALVLSFSSYLYYERAVPNIEGKEFFAEGTVSEVQSSGNKTSFFFDSDSINGEKAHVQMLVCSYSGDIVTLGSGDRVRISGIADGESDPIFGYSDKAYLNSNGAFLSCDTDEIQVLKRVNSVTKFFDELKQKTSARLSKLEYKGIADAVLLGDKSEIDPTLKENLRKCGASHTLAVSGLHLSVLILSLYALLRRLTVPYRVNAVITCLFALFYMALTGLSPGIARSGCMLILFLAAGVLRRESDSITNLFAAAGIILLFNRYAIYDIGFQLTFLSTLGIIAVGVPYSAFVKKLYFMRDLNEKGRVCGILYRLISIVFTSFSITVSAVFFTLPVTMLRFGEVSLISPIANLFILFVFEPALICAAVFLVFSLALGGFGFASGIIAVLGKLCDGLFGIYAALARFFGSFEHASGFVLYPFLPYFIAACVIFVLILAFLKLKKKYFIFVPIVIFITFIGVKAVYIASDDAVRLAYIDVYCDKKLVAKTKEGTVIFEPKTVDYANDKDALTDCVFKLGADKIDCYVINGYSKGLSRQLDIMNFLFDIKSVMLPEPVGDSEKALLDEAREKCASVTVFSYGEALRECGIEFTPIFADEKTRGFKICANGKTAALISSTSPQKQSISELWSGADYVVLFGKNVIRTDLPLGSPSLCALEGKNYCESDLELIKSSCGKTVDLSETKVFMLTLPRSGNSRLSR